VTRKSVAYAYEESVGPNLIVADCFLVAQPISTSPNAKSAVYVYDEAGNLEETVSGLDFRKFGQTLSLRLVINPATRSAWINGPRPNQLQKFYY
jgi:hypothetical protein